MKKVIKFNSSEVIEFTKEKIKAIDFNFKALTAALAVAGYSNGNQIAVKIELIRGGKTISLVNDYLDRIMVNTIGNSPLARSFNDISETSIATYNYRHHLGGGLHLVGDDKLRVVCNAKNTAFTSLSTTESEISIESVPTQQIAGYVNVMELYPIGLGKVDFDEDLGSSVHKIMHFGQSSLAGADLPIDNAHFEDIDLTADGYKKSVTKDVLNNENYLRMSAMGDVAVDEIFMNTILFEGIVPLNNVHLKGKLSESASNTDYVLVTRRVAV